MFEKILTSIDSIGHFSAAEKALFTSRLTAKTVAKNAFLLKEGQTCSTLFFLNAGAVRSYHVTEAGDECTVNLFVENDWVLDFDSFIRQKPARNNLIASEESFVWALSVHDLHALITQAQAFFLLGKILGGVNNPLELVTQPEERYQYILTHRPEVLQKFPLRHVASYLKMTPETLSRVRRKIQKN